MFYKSLISIKFKLKNTCIIKKQFWDSEHSEHHHSSSNYNTIVEFNRDYQVNIIKKNSKILKSLYSLLRKYNTTNKINTSKFLINTEKAYTKLLLLFSSRFYSLLKQVNKFNLLNNVLVNFLKKNKKHNTFVLTTRGDMGDVYSKYYNALSIVERSQNYNTIITFYRKLRIIFTSIIHILKSLQTVYKQLYSNLKKSELPSPPFKYNNNGIFFYTLSGNSSQHSLFYLDPISHKNLNIYMSFIFYNNEYLLNKRLVKFTIYNNLKDNLTLDNNVELKDENSVESQLNDFLFKSSKDPFTKLHSIDDYALDLFSSFDEFEDFDINLGEDDDISSDFSTSIKGSSDDLIVHKATKFNEQSLNTIFRRIQQDFLTNMFKESTTLIQVNYVNSIPVPFLFEEGNYILRKFPFLIRTRVASQIIGALLSCLKHKDPRILLTIIVKSFLKTHYSKHKPIFKMWEFFITSYSDQFLASFSVAGLKLEFRGKLAVGGNARKRAYIFRTGLSSNSAKITKSLLQQDVVKTATGTFSCNLSIFF